MDEMKLVTKFTRGIVSKIIERAIRKNTGCETSIQLNSASISNNEDRAHIHLDVDAFMPRAELLKILKNVGLG